MTGKWNAFIGLMLAPCLAVTGCAPYAAQDQETSPADTGMAPQGAPEARVERSFAAGIDLKDGSHVYSIQMHLQLDEDICIPEIARGETLDSQGVFVSGRLRGDPEFEFDPLLSSATQNIDTVMLGADIDFIQVSFRSNFKADELAAQIPYIRCSAPGRLDWDKDKDGTLASGWKSLSE